MKNWNDLTYNEKLVCLSLFPEEAKKDENWVIRIEYYKANRDDEDAKKDENWRIRREYYRAKGFDEEAKKDEDEDIRREAEIYFEMKNDIKK